MLKLVYTKWDGFSTFYQHLKGLQVDRIPSNNVMNCVEGLKCRPQRAVP